MSMNASAPSRWLRQTCASPAAMTGVTLLGAGGWGLHSASPMTAGGWPLICLGAALLGWQRGSLRAGGDAHAVLGAHADGRSGPAFCSAPVPLSIAPSTPVETLPSAKETADATWDAKRLSLVARAFEQSGAAMVITDALDRIALVNESFVRLSGMAASDLIGQPAELLGMAPLRASHLPGIDEALRRGERWSGESNVTTCDGRTQDMWLAVGIVRNEAGRVSHHARVFQDVAPLKAQLRQMADQARHDTLTGLANRRAFGELMFQAMARARRYTKTLAIMCVDLDGFKSVNDSRGHQVGDQLLVTVARRLETCVRTTDRVCRTGGDEFMLVLEGPGHTDEITRIGERVIQAMKTPYELDGKPVQISSSVGVAVYDGQENDQDLIRRADTAMYAAKHAGKGQMVFVMPPAASTTYDYLKVVPLRA